MRTSTALIPRYCAHATPPKVVGPGAIRAPLRGTSMRDWVLIGACADQPNLVQ